MHPDVDRIIVTKEEIAEKVSVLAGMISKDYENRNPLLISVLKGAFIFMADLLREVTIPCNVDFMAVSSYGKKSATTGAVKILKDLDCKVEGRHVIIVEDILDSGLTLRYIINYLAGGKPASVRVCTLLDKPSRRQADIRPDYTGFIVPDEFIVGYGLDYADRYRNLPYVGVLKREIYS